MTTTRLASSRPPVEPGLLRPARIRTRSRACIRATAILLASAAALLSATPVAGQPSRPIYPVYEGYVPMDDGVAVLVFGYYSHNAVPVEIAAGDANGFLPGPADRGQPTVFEPGRQRNVCFLVLPADHEGNVAWSLAWAGTTRTTTERGGIDPLYLIESISGAWRMAQRIDTTTAEHGVCVVPEPPPNARETR